MKRYILVVIVSFLSVISISAQYRNPQFIAYVEQYYLIAMEHQHQYKIPSSITLAQGLFESGAGNSILTRQSNNHFGIKCNNGWTGPRVFHDDDKKDDCFRKYERAQESYEDHSIFLSRNPRYAALFDLNIRDYRGWAMGLQRAGYATDKSYANKIIKIIEDYELYHFDVLAMGPGKTAKLVDTVRTISKQHDVFISQGLLYVSAKVGDTYETIALEVGVKVKSLMEFNEVPKDFPLNEGDIVYLQKKNKQVKGFENHIIKPGESMHSISQMYGIRMKYLYKINKLDGDYIPNDGDTLKLK
ncbi:MAG: glucosaminidase domain-containing protein [Bacteroidales bacterium]